MVNLSKRETLDINFGDDLLIFRTKNEVSK